MLNYLMHDKKIEKRGKKKGEEKKRKTSAVAARVPSTDKQTPVPCVAQNPM